MLSITFLFDKEESKFIFVELFHKNKTKIPDKNRINELCIKEIEISDGLYEHEEAYLNSINDNKYESTNNG